ncbi:MAG: hypothetical protein J3R72DRAFT_452795 [Linnemannia gamsii]|nr:MAG: hypothetical protein J3R72DRAFT_452795 [Linnemannia gamsii]
MHSFTQSFALFLLQTPFSHQFFPKKNNLQPTTAHHLTLYPYIKPYTQPLTTPPVVLVHSDLDLRDQFNVYFKIFILRTN